MAIVNYFRSSGSGDMEKSVYDVDDDQRADVAEALNNGTVSATIAEIRTAIDTTIPAKANSSDLTAHIDDTTDAHAASAITNTPSGNLAATTAQGALNELQTDVDTRATVTALNDHINDTVDAHDASAVSFTPFGAITATDVQAAVQQIISTASGAISLIKFGGVNLSQNATRYLRPVGQAGDNGTEANTRIQIRQPTTISELRAVLSAAVPASQTVVVTLRKNAADTALTFTISAGATTGSDITHSVDFDTGDWLAIKSVTSATFGTTNDINVTAVCKTLNGNLAVPVVGFGNMGFGTAGYLGESGGTQFGTESHGQVPLRRCVIARVYQTDDSAGTDLFLRRNGVSISPQLSTNMTDGQFQTAGACDLDAHSYSENDLVTLLQNNNVSTNGTLVLYNESAPSDVYAPVFFASQGQAQATTRYMGGWNASSASATESDVNIPMPAGIVHSLRVHASAAPPSGQTCVITVRKNGVDTGLTVTITSAGTTFTNTVNTVTYVAGDTLSISSVSSATAGTLSYTASLEIRMQ